MHKPMYDDIVPIPTLSLQRLISLRWMSVVAMIVAALIGQHISGGALFIAPLLAVAAVMFSVNTCLNLALLLDPKGLVRTSLFAPLVQLGFDLIGWGAYVFYSGGAANPLIAVFLPFAAFGALVLPPVQAWVYGIAAIGTYTFLWICHVPFDALDAGVAERWSHFGMWTVFVVSATVVIWFVSRMMQAIRQRNATLAKVREDNTRNRWLIFVGTLAAGTAHQMSTPLGTLQILVDDLLSRHRSDADLRADLELMQAQIARCKTSLTDLTVLAGNPRNEALPFLTLGDWLKGITEAWQSSQPGGQVTLELAPDLQGVSVQPDFNLDSAIQNLLHPATPGGHPVLTIAARRDGGQVALQIDGLDTTAETVERLVTDGSELKDRATDGAAIEALGGHLSSTSRGDGRMRLSVILPGTLLRWA